MLRATILGKASAAVAACLLLSQVKGITFLRGARAFADFKAAIDGALSEAAR